MSSILDALAKLERTGDPPTVSTAGSPLPTPPPRGRRPLVLALVVVAFVTGAGIAVLLAGRDEPPLPPPIAPQAAAEPAPVPVPSLAAVTATVATPAPAVAPPLAAGPLVAADQVVALPVPPPVPVPAMDERPWAHPTPEGGPELGEEPHAAFAARDVPAGRLAVALAPGAGGLAAAPPEPDLAVQTATRSRPPQGAPPVRLSFLLYSPNADRRSVALQIDGGLATLHEGDEASGVIVERIFPDRAELSWNGERFTVRARD